MEDRDARGHRERAAVRWWHGLLGRVDLENGWHSQAPLVCPHRQRQALEAPNHWHLTPSPALQLRAQLVPNLSTRAAHG